jgi:hypothetical protein
MKLRNIIRIIAGAMLLTITVTLSSCTKNLYSADAVSNDQQAGLKSSGEFSKSTGTIPSPYTDTYQQKYDGKVMR